MGFTASLVVCQLLTDHLQNILHWAVRLKYAPERCNQKQTNFSSGSMEREKWVWQPLFWSVSRWLTIFKSKQSWQAPKFCLQWRLICLNGLNQKIIRPLRCFGWMAFDFLHGRNASKPAVQASPTRNEFRSGTGGMEWNEFLWNGTEVEWNGMEWNGMNKWSGEMGFALSGYRSEFRRI